MDLTLDIALIAGLGVLVFMIMQLIKSTVDVAMGKDKRKDNVWVTRVILPAVPPLLGCLLGAFMPLRPSSLIEFANEYLTGFDHILVYSAYGAVVGQFSDHIYSKAKAFFEDFRAKKKK